MLMTLQQPCNNFFEHYIMTGKRPKSFNVKGGKNNTSGEKCFIGYSPNGVPVFQNWWLCHSKIRRYETLPKSRETSVAGAKQKLRLISLQRVMSEFRSRVTSEFYNE